VALVACVHGAGAASRTSVRDRRRAAGRRARSISAHLKLRNDEAKTRVLAITGELADLAETTAAEASRVLVNARRHLARSEATASGRLIAAVAELDTILARTGRVVSQTRTRLSGVTPVSATRLVSLHDPDARPIDPDGPPQGVPAHPEAAGQRRDRRVIAGQGVGGPADRPRRQRRPPGLERKLLGERGHRARRLAAPEHPLAPHTTGR